MTENKEKEVQENKEPINQEAQKVQEPEVGKNPPEDKEQIEKINEKPPENKPEEDKFEDDYITFPQNEICHKLLLKGCNIDTNHYYYYKCHKIKQKSTSLFPLWNKPKTVKIDYLIFFDESFLYLMKDIEIDKNKPNLRKLGNKYSLYNLINANFNKTDDPDVLKLTIEFVHENNPELFMQKEYYFHSQFAGPFFEELRENLLNLHIMELGMGNEIPNADSGENKDQNNNISNEGEKTEEKKEDIKNEPKESDKGKPKEVVNEDVKEEPKEDVKEEPKEDVKEEPKEDVKEGEK